MKTLREQGVETYLPKVKRMKPDIRAGTEESKKKAKRLNVTIMSEGKL